jgi:hypothetical protein
MSLSKLEKKVIFSIVGVGLVQLLGLGVVIYLIVS